MLTMEAWRLKIGPCSPMVADSHHFPEEQEQEQDPDPH
jgi:hypothetical protein